MRKINILLSSLSILLILFLFQRVQRFYFKKVPFQLNSNQIISTPSQKNSINNQYIINNNLAQYSAYLIVDQNSVTIEVFVHLNRKYVNYEHFGSKENFTCVLKLKHWKEKKILLN
jgi:hypothetical protein